MVKWDEGKKTVSVLVNGGAFLGLAWLLRGIYRGRSPREILRSSSASPRKMPSFQNLLLRFTFFFYEVSILALLKCIDSSVLAFLKSRDGYVFALIKFIDGSVLAFFRFPSIFSHQNSTDREFC